jgi:phosphoenolpyruvate synthase/pyruvate phosphate dikinase
MKTILEFNTAELPGLDQVGGKALSLITMTREGMIVPPGLVLTVDFFQPWMLDLQATPEWGALQNSEGYGLSQATKALQSLCRKLRFGPHQQEELDFALGSFRASFHVDFFAVRSSSPEEDLGSASFAGGYETTLGVKAEGLQAAILHSFASSLDERVFLYKRMHGFPTDQLRIAVIIQQQVDADRAGVAFSLNPLNNCFDEAVISANYGLGETVVAGEVDPDVFLVDKITHKIMDTKIGGKAVVTTLNPKGGTTQTLRANDHQACLTPTQVLQVVDLLDQVESTFKKPIDIEWAISMEKIYLLQARPITTYLPLPEEMMTAPGVQRQLYADATLIEQGLQEPMSILGADFLGYVLREMTGPLGRDVTGIDGIAFTAGGRYYLQLSNSIKMMGLKSPLAPGSMGDTSVVEILESIDLKQYTPKKLPRKLATTRSSMLFRMIPTLFSAMKIYRDPDAFMQKYMEAYPSQLNRMEEFLNQDLSIKELAGKLNSIVHFFSVVYGVPMFLIPQLVENRLKGMFKEGGSQVKDALVSLGVALPGSKPAEMGQLMYQLASFDEIKRHNSVEEFVINLQKRSLDPIFLKEWDRFMLEFGFRCPREIDVATPRPNEQPALLFEQLKNISLAIDVRKGSKTIFEEARAKRGEAYRLLKAISFQKGKRAGKAFEKGYKILISFGGHGKETSKHYIVMVMDVFRKRVLKIAQTFMEADRLDHPNQIFDLTIEDIDHALIGRSLDLRALAKERTMLLNKIKQSHLIARVIDSRGKIYSPPRKEARTGELIGVPISPGIVQGKVKVLHRIDEKNFLPGEILVTRATDPGWTPLFINAKGIILEIGGALQHGAVVAREYGIPCVSGLDGATDKLRDGQLVEVDGSNGIVHILEENTDG